MSDEQQRDTEALPTWRVTEPDDETTLFGRAEDDRAEAERAISEARVPSAGEQAAYAEATGDGGETAAWPVSPAHQAPEAPTANPITDTGSAYIPPMATATGEMCPTCGGIVPSDHELLLQIRELISPIGPAAMHLFYERLFTYAPDLRELFPARIEVQEEKLLSAIAALLTLFQAGETEMDQLDAELAKLGRSHTRFAPAATIEEYATVWRSLSEVVNEALGAQLTPRHGEVLRRAYEYAAGKMLASQATARLNGQGRRRRTS